MPNKSQFTAARTRSALKAVADQRRDPRSAIAVTCDCEGSSNATTKNISRHGLLLSGPMHAKVGDRFVIRVDVEGGLTLSTQVRHTTGGDVGLEIDGPNPMHLPVSDESHDTEGTFPPPYDP